MDIIEKIATRVKSDFQHAHASHDWEHTDRVYQLAVRLAKVEGADLHIVSLAALLHDIARHSEDQKQGQLCHAVEGAKIARQLLAAYQVATDKIEKISHCIQTHRYRNNHHPESLEARVLFDADKLDSIGAIGIGRAFLFAGEIGARLHNHDTPVAAMKAYSSEDTAYREYMVKLRHIKDQLYTNEGKRLAQGRHDFMVTFFDRLNKEVTGEC